MADFKSDGKGIVGRDDSDFKSDGKGFGGLLGRSDAQSGGGGMVFVTFVGAAGIDVRNLAANILFGRGDAGTRRPRSRIANIASQALLKAREEEKARANAAKDIAAIVQSQLSSLGYVAMNPKDAVRASGKTAAKANGQLAAKANGKIAAKMKGKSGAALTAQS